MLDANDNTPRFVNAASISVGEDTPQGTVLLPLVARDPDAGPNGTVVYEIITGNEQGMTYYPLLLNNTYAVVTIKNTDSLPVSVLYQVSLL